MELYYSKTRAFLTLDLLYPGSHRVGPAVTWSMVQVVVDARMRKEAACCEGCDLNGNNIC